MRYGYIRASVRRAQAQGSQSVSVEAPVTSVYRSALAEIVAAASAIASPNGTTRKLGRIATEALAG